MLLHIVDVFLNNRSMVGCVGDLHDGATDVAGHASTLLRGSRGGLSVVGGGRHVEFWEEGLEWFEKKKIV